MPDPFIMVAPNGARRGKADHSALPITVTEIVKDAAACRAAGADGLHLHVRDAQGRHSLDPGLYREALSALAEAVPDMRVQITTEAAGQFDVGMQLACLESVVPDWASVSVREIANSPEAARRLYSGCHERGTQIQHILYDLGDLAQLRSWQSDGTVRPDQLSVIFVLGQYAPSRKAKVDDLDRFLAAWKNQAEWMICAFGPQEHACLAAAAVCGGNLRVGFENSLIGPDGTPHESNAASVSALKRALNSMTEPA